MRILVTGATGFVGSHLTRRLAAEGHAVRILRRDRSRLEALGDCPFEEMIGDITDATAVDRAVAGCDVVIHSAALIQYWVRRDAEQSAINVEGTRHVVHAALQHRVQRLIHVSSIAAIGYDPSGGLADETTPYNLGPFRNNYCNTKYAAELVVREGVRQGLDAVIVNPGTIYGPGDRRRLGYIRGLMSPVTTHGGTAVVDVEDVVEGILRAWRHGRTGERYIFIAENISFREIGRQLARLCNRHGPRVAVPTVILHLVAAVSDRWARCTRRPPRLTPSMARMANLQIYFSNAKACRELGLTFRPFADTAARTMAWYHAQCLV